MRYYKSGINFSLCNGIKGAELNATSVMLRDFPQQNPGTVITLEDPTLVLAAVM